jgi:hypothetical protein
VKAPSLESLLHLGSHGRRQSPRLHQSRLARWKHCLLVSKVLSIYEFSCHRAAFAINIWRSTDVFAATR